MGRKSTAENICYGAFDVIKEKTGNDPLKVFKAALENVKPVLEVKPRRVGGATYQVPIEIRPSEAYGAGIQMADYLFERQGREDHEGETCRRTS